MNAPHLRVLSLGAGVQSTTLALMAAHGEIGPMPDCAIFADDTKAISSVVRPTTPYRFCQCREAATQFGATDPVAPSEHAVQPGREASPSRPLDARRSFGIDLQSVVTAHPELSRLDDTDRLPGDPVRREATVIDPSRTDGNDGIGLKQFQAPQGRAKAEKSCAHAHLVIPETSRDYCIGANIRSNHNQPQSHRNKNAGPQKAHKDARIGSPKIDCTHRKTPSLEYSAYSSQWASEVRRSTKATAARDVSRRFQQLGGAGLHCGGGR